MKQTYIRIASLAAVLLAILLLHPASARAQTTAVLHPVAGERFAAGGSSLITWSPEALPGTVTISLWNAVSGTWLTVASHLPADRGWFEWKVPAELEGEMFRVRIAADEHPDRYAMSDAFFFIDPVESATAGAPMSSADESQLEMSPSPAADLLRMSWTGVEPRHLVMHDMQGNEALAMDVPSGGTSVDVPVGHLRNGAYLVDVEMAGGARVVRKVTIRR
jgi:hypothetical protein